MSHYEVWVKLPQFKIEVDAEDKSDAIRVVKGDFTQYFVDALPSIGDLIARAEINDVVFIESAFDAKGAAIKYLEEVGYKILDSDNDCFDIVAINEDENSKALVFIEVCDEFFANIPVRSDTRALYEEDATRWLGQNENLTRALFDPITMCFQLRFDRISVIKTGDTHAMIKHHLNILKEPNNE